MFQLYILRSIYFMRPGIFATKWRMMLEDLQLLASNQSLFFKEVRGQTLSTKHRDIVARMIITLQKRNKTYQDQQGKYLYFSSCRTLPP